ncbi:MAG: 4-(cytidine 5'-diphospho)-2-C-methyl-D-erythritol kinase [Treponema sp.]|nr:4-(cytidine 5'-diphospho)-2-C-methyl-D-erythritol kinase [Treponema sp.]
MNLHLRIGDVRPDGFHNIESLFLALAHGDSLCLETASGGPSTEILMNWRVPGIEAQALPPEKNIVFHAVNLFRNRTGYDKGLKVTVEKRIPPGGGLGGGSSDAAAALLALNRLSSPGSSRAGGGLLSAESLAALGASLGSDIPFFLSETLSSGSSAAWVGGRGEKVRPLGLRHGAGGLAFVLVNPGFPSDTAAAYQLLDAHRRENPLSRPQNGPSQELSLSGRPESWPFSNDFLPVFQARAGKGPPAGTAGGVYREILAGLEDAGAGFSGLSGSGSTCFGVFPGQEKAGAALVSLRKKWPWVILTFPLARRAIKHYNTE